MLKYFTLKSHKKQLMLMGEKRGRTKEENTKQLQDLDPKGSPHLEEIWFGGIVDLDLLSLFPLNGGKNHGGMERNQALKRSTMEERERKKLVTCCGRRPLK